MDHLPLPGNHHLKENREKKQPIRLNGRHLDETPVR